MSDKVNRKLVEGEYITLQITEKQDLQITLTKEGKKLFDDEFISEIKDCHSIWSNDTIEIIFTKSYDDIWSELFEDIRCNSDIEFLGYDNAERGVYLTSSPFIGYGVEYDEDFSIKDIKHLFYFREYEIKSELQLLYTSKVLFLKVENQ